jgi:hypothetical protein
MKGLLPTGLQACDPEDALSSGRLAFAVVEVFDPENADVLSAQDVAGPDDDAAKCYDTEIAGGTDRTRSAEKTKHEGEGTHTEIRFTFIQLAQPANGQGSARTCKAECGEE